MAPDAPVIRYRRPAEADYEPIVDVLDEWWSGRAAADADLRRIWLQHFTGTSWLAETSEGTQLTGFLVGFLSPDRIDQAFCHLIGVSPNQRRRGIGTELYERFFADARAGGRTTVVAVAWPANHGAIAFHEALGFRVDVGPGTQNLYGVPSRAGYDLGREDRTLFVRTL
jgi:GNAT superfamily N-acetyltransferase